MLQRPDYSILDPLTEICEVVGYNLCYLYVNDAATEWEDNYKDKLIGRPVLEFHPEIESTPLFRHLKECLAERKPIEFEDELFHPGSAGTRWKIRIDPVREGVLIHAVGLSPFRSKLRVSRLAAPAGITGNPARHTMDPWPVYKSAGGDPARDLQIEGWLDELDLRTHETNEHIHHVADGTVALAKMAGLSGSEIVQVRRGALLHDIGKIGVSETILMKPGELTAEEWQVIRKHPIFAYELFYPIEYLRECLAIPYSHHEKWDGTGYPLGLKGEQIPLPARLFAVVEVWDKLSCDRVHGRAWPQEKITQYIQEQSGSHFDPQVVDLFFRSQRQFARLTA